MTDQENKQCPIRTAARLHGIELTSDEVSEIKVNVMRRLKTASEEKS